MNINILFKYSKKHFDYIVNMI